MDRHTYDSGIIGNCAYIAHVEKNSNISWLCWPSFEDSFVFGSLLDKEKGGEFSILPINGIKYSSQYYLENTNVLCTRIESADGSYKITDFAPRFEQYERYYKPLTLIRKIEPIENQPAIKVLCEPVYDYGQREFTKIRGSNHIRFQSGNIRIQIASNLPVSHLYDGHSFLLSRPIYLIMT